MKTFLRRLFGLKPKPELQALPTLHLRIGDILVIHTYTAKAEDFIQRSAQLRNLLEPKLPPGTEIIIVASYPPIGTLIEAASNSTTGVVPPLLAFQVIRLWESIPTPPKA